MTLSCKINICYFNLWKVCLNCKKWKTMGKKVRKIKLLILNSVHFFFLIFISWRLITLQYCSGFCHTLTWISHRVTCIPHPDPPSYLPLYPIPLGWVWANSGRQWRTEESGVSQSMGSQRAGRDWRTEQPQPEYSNSEQAPSWKLRRFWMNENFLWVEIFKSLFLRQFSNKLKQLFFRANQ